MASRTLSPLATISTSPSLQAAFVGWGRTQDLWRPPLHLSLGVNPSSNEHFLSTYGTPGTILGAGNAAMNETDPDSWCSRGGEVGQTIRF